MSIEEKSKELAKLLKDTPEFEKLKSSQTRLKLDPGAQDLLNQLQQKQENLQQAQLEGKQPAPQEIAQFQSLQQQAQHNLTIKAIFEAQEKFNEVMEKVNNSIMEELFS